ncbi:MAG: hypothetical protein IKC65_03130 [Lentisphaeria bacterium]|nr:hypothetical protein [Lentisphaeria bacterium]
MKILQDLHIHSHHSFDVACAALSDIRADHEAMGIMHYAVTDHLNTRYSLSDLESCYHDFLSADFPENFHFGVELTPIAAWEAERIACGDFIPKGLVPLCGFREEDHPFDGRISLALEEGEREKYGIEIVVAGVHWPLGFPAGRADALENYFIQTLFLASHPLVDVLAHPWDSLSHAAGDWFRHRDREHIDFSIYKEIPADMDEQIGRTLKENGKLAEMNIPVILNAPEEVQELHMKRFCKWRDQGVQFTCGSDQHSAHPDPDRFARMEQLLEQYGFREEDFVLPPSIRRN